MLRMKGLLLSQKVELTRLLQLKLDLNKDFDIFFILQKRYFGMTVNSVNLNKRI